MTESVINAEYSLRPYQEEAVQRLAEAGRSGKRRVVLHMPTGGGKTIVAAELIRRATHDKAKRVLFLAPRRELVYQCVAKLEALGVHAGIIMAGEVPDSLAPVQVATVPTLHRRAVVGEKLELPPADFVIADEAHLFLAATYQNLIEQYPDAFVLGLTATPARGDGRGLGEIWDVIVPGSTVTSLVETGFLVPQRYFAPAKPDLAGIQVRRGDYAEDQLATRMDTPKLVGDTVTNWLRLGEDRQTVVFASGVAHSKHLKERFLESGVNAEHLDGTTPNDERADILRRLESGQTRVLCNCFVLTFGWDCPPVSCAVVARPTKSLVLYLQMCGRVLRPYPGKEDCLIIDHSGIVEEHGFIDEDFPWSLDGKEKIRDRVEAKRPKEGNPITCPACSFIFRMSPRCPSCGWMPEGKKPQPKLWVDGDLQEVKRNGKRKPWVWTMDEKRIFMGELLTLAKRRGYKEGWAAYKYRERLGVWPKLGDVPLYEPRRETVSWVRSRQIAWAKSRENPANA